MSEFSQILERLGKLEQDVAVVKNDVQNHIPTFLRQLESRINHLDSRLWLFLGLIPAVAIATAVLVERVFK